MPDQTDARPTVLERVTSARGELVLRRVGEHLEVISNGTFLMDTRDGRSERLLVRAALAEHGAARRVLVGGLGVGFSLVEALADDAVESVTVVEVEPTLVAWHAKHFGAVTGAALDDPRVEVVVADLVGFGSRRATPYDVVCLDTDNGPSWTVTPGNARLYDDAGTAALVRLLRPGGVLAVWSARPEPAYEALLRRHLTGVRALETEVRRGAPDLVYVGRRGPAAP